MKSFCHNYVRKIPDKDFPLLTVPETFILKLCLITLYSDLFPTENRHLYSQGCVKFFFSMPCKAKILTSFQTILRKSGESGMNIQELPLHIS